MQDPLLRTISCCHCREDLKAMHYPCRDLAVCILSFDFLSFFFLHRTRVGLCRFLLLPFCIDTVFARPIEPK